MNFIPPGADRPRGFRLAIAPLVDVVFLLLIFFLCASQPRTPEGDFDTRLPSLHGTQPQHRPAESIERVTVSVRLKDPAAPPDRAEAVIAVEGTPVAGYDALVGKLARLGPDRLMVVITAEALVPTRFVVLVLDACSAAGCTRIAFGG